MLDTHSYDGRLDSKNINEIDNVRQLSNDDKLLVINELLEHINTKISDEGLFYLKTIINDIGTDHNYDPTNNLRAEDLLYISKYYQDNDDFVNNLDTQLQDMKTGFCPQGRTHRLYQIILSFQTSS